MSVTTETVMTYEKSGVSFTVSAPMVRVPVTGTAITRTIQEIDNSSAEQLDFGDVTTPGMVWFRNLDATNYVEINAGTGLAMTIRLNAGDDCRFRCAPLATAPFAQANGAAVDLEMCLIEA